MVKSILNFPEKKQQAEKTQNTYLAGEEPRTENWRKGRLAGGRRRKIFFTRSVSTS
jgi:hypothetical protein